MCDEDEARRYDSVSELSSIMEELSEFEEADEVLERSAISAEILDGSFLDVSMEETISSSAANAEDTSGEHANIGRFECGICSKKYSRKSDLNRHVKSHSSEHACSTCHLYFDSLTGLQNHLQEKHKHLCSICGRKFWSKNSLKEHSTKHPENVQVGMLKCTECPLMFTRKSRLEGHMNTHRQIKPIKCDNCGKTFCHMSSLTTHRYVCVDQRSFMCLKCGKSFKRKDYLNQHDKTIHLMTMHICLCGKTYAHQSSLYKHKKKCSASQ